MRIKKVKENLCAYDPRNPGAQFDTERQYQKKPCSCDNCFYGRHKLAETILNMMDAVTETKRRGQGYQPKGERPNRVGKPPRRP